MAASAPPGELRASQNWIGASDSTIESARFVPAPPAELAALLSDWERFANEEPKMPLLAQNALLHSQFETIRPFLDVTRASAGSCSWFSSSLAGACRRRCSTPPPHLERHRERYYDALSAVHETGDASSWLELFLTGVEIEARDVVARAERLVEVRERHLRAVVTMATANG